MRPDAHEYDTPRAICSVSFIICSMMLCWRSRALARTTFLIQVAACTTPGELLFTSSPAHTTSTTRHDGGLSNLVVLDRTEIRSPLLPCYLTVSLGQRCSCVASQCTSSVASIRPSGALSSTPATTRTIATTPTSWRRCICSPSCCSHHLQPFQPNPATEHKSVDVSFSSGQEAGSRMKGY